MKKSEKEWAKELSVNEFNILREKGTEPAFSGKYDKLYEKGVYVCKGCGEKLFEGEAKFDSGCGWPSFSQAADPNILDETLDTSRGTVRTEITCSKCDGHMGHVFEDGPTPTGRRFCVNSASIVFKAKK